MTSMGFEDFCSQSHRGAYSLPDVPDLLRVPAVYLAHAILAFLALAA